MKTESTRSKNALLIVVCLAQFMVILDVAIVNVALPSMRAGLHFSTTGLQWVVNAYTLTFAGFLMLGGRSADLLGRRRVFLVGTALFALSSLGCALADSRTLLITARAIQGVRGVSKEVCRHDRRGLSCLQSKRNQMFERGSLVGRAPASRQASRRPRLGSWGRWRTICGPSFRTSSSTSCWPARAVRRRLLGREACSRS